MKLRKLTRDDVRFEIDCAPEDIEVRGNALASGDDALDREVEDEIIARLRQGDTWAWCTVRVRCLYRGHSRVDPDPAWPEDVRFGLVGYDVMGACSYKDELDFRENSGHFEDMCRCALENLNKEIEELAAQIEPFVESETQKEPKNMTYEKEKLTITLTGRAPVVITKGEWPKIADASWHDGQVFSQANRRHYLNVRQHADGRTIVYGIRDSDWRGETNRRGGEVLPAGGDIPAAVHRVARDLDFDQAFAEECIAGLPPEPL